MAPQPAFAQPWQPGPPRFGPAGLPPASMPVRPSGGAGRIVAAIAALPFALFLALICVVGMVADGMAVNEILKEHPTLEAEDIAEALQYVAEAVRERMIPLEA